MDAHKDTPRIEVLSVSDTTRRRRWTDDEKLRIIEESYRDGALLSEVARRHEVSRSQLYDWRYRHRHGLLGSAPQFLRVLPLEDASDGSDDKPAPPAPVLTVDLGARCRVTIPSEFDLEAAAQLINSLTVAS